MAESLQTDGGLFGEDVEGESLASFTRGGLFTEEEPEDGPVVQQRTGGLLSEDEGPENEGEELIGRTSLFAEEEGPENEGEELIGRTSLFSEEDPEGGDPDVQGFTADFDADRFELGSEDAGVAAFEQPDLASDDPGGWLD